MPQPSAGTAEARETFDRLLGETEEGDTGPSNDNS